MDFRREMNEEDDERTSSFTPHPIRESAFSKPQLPSSSSLLAAGGARNGEPGAGGGGGRGGEQASARYRDCQRNHAASLGGHVLDGCGEFMPGAADPMKCAACGCHRSFHRREGDGDQILYTHRHHNGSNFAGGGGGVNPGRIPLLLPPPHLPNQLKQTHCFPASPSAAMVAFGQSGGGTTTESSSEELGRVAAVAGAGSGHRPLAKKRFRTKFTAEQKMRMLEFAERIRWRIQRQDEAEMERFCSDVGVSRQVFKVWMHNNKHSVQKPQLQPPPEQPPPQQPQQGPDL
ncbi:ZF-HD homeobox protein [Apostasia shenzhenica]|uniref:ZF-HD homeobox protein n=1 Tax=Apostasia shenzhenica TaxID=1088818 RepID=A0A2I0A1B1_9ASPA|nr:ZF-HD homeobox protein [Apostasia shenzhenica]